MKKLKNKIALVTGATSGIGEACAKLFAEHGAKVVLCGRNAEKGILIEREIYDKGGDAKFICCDISNEEQVAKLISSTIETYNALDILFNNAGTMLPSMEIERMPVSEWRKTFDVNEVINHYFLVLFSLLKSLVYHYSS